MKLRDRSWAEQQLARHAGLFNDRVPIEEFDPDRMTDDQLTATLVALAERGSIEIEGVAVEVDDERSSPDLSSSNLDPGVEPTPEPVDDASR